MPCNWSGVRRDSIHSVPALFFDMRALEWFTTCIICQAGLTSVITLQVQHDSLRATFSLCCTAARHAQSRPILHQRHMHRTRCGW